MPVRSNAHPVHNMSFKMIERVCRGGGGGEKERERHRETETDGQAGSQTDRGKDRDTETHRLMDPRTIIQLKPLHSI